MGTKWFYNRDFFAKLLVTTNECIWFISCGFRNLKPFLFHVLIYCYILFLFPTVEMAVLPFEGSGSSSVFSGKCWAVCSLVVAPFIFTA